jgi:hypothetical protein
MRPLREIVGAEGVLFGFSDYRERGNYSTSTLFLTTEPHWKALSRRLREIRLEKKVASESLQYKNRKKWARLWPSAIEPWLVAFRETPSLTVCVAHSKQFRAEPSYAVDRREAREHLRAGGSQVPVAVAIATALKLLPFVLMAPQLNGGALAWNSDRDAMLEGAQGEELMEWLLTYLDHAGGNISVVQPQYSDRLPEESEVILSLPDLVSGLVADLLPCPFVPTTLNVGDLDSETFTLFAGVSQMGCAFTDDGIAGKLHVAVLDRGSDGSRLLPLAFAARGRSSAEPVAPSR